MKIKMSLKLALFTFLSAVACLIANRFICLIEISMVAEVLWFLSYICLVIWTSTYIAKTRRVGRNMAVSFFTLAIAVYFGIYYNIVEDPDFLMVFELLFYVAALVCLGSVLLLLGRWIFGTSKQKDEDTTEQSATCLNSWTCTCGAVNTGKFCSECGNVKPELPVEVLQKG